MGVVTVPQANPNDELTDTLINQGPNAIAAAVNGNLDDANIATISGSKISAGSLPATALTADANPLTREFEAVGDFVASGLIWSQTSGLAGTMTAGVAYVSGKRLTIGAIASYSFTASRDTYVYLDEVGVIQHNPQTNGAAQPVTAQGAQLIAKVVTSASAITQVNDTRASGLRSEWRSWLPAWTNLTVGNGTVSSTFQKIGTTVNASYSLKLGSTSSVTGPITGTLPVAARSSLLVPTLLGAAYVNLPGSEAYPGVVRSLSASSFTLDGPISSTDTRLTRFTTNKPIASWTTGAELTFAITFEAA